MLQFCEVRTQYRVLMEERPLFATPASVAAWLMGQFDGEPVECVGVLCLDIKHRATRWEITSRGTLDTAMMHARDIFRTAVAQNAAAVIVAHNHPSGDPEPSRQDIETTTRLKAAGELLGVGLLDSIIVGGARYFSFQERGKL